VKRVAARKNLRYEQVADLVERQIESGSLKPRERVPSVRTMSRNAGVSVGTVVQAYLHLERRGLLETRPRSGFFVAPRSAALESPSSRETRSRTPRTVAPRVVDTVLAALARTDLVALNSAVTNPASRLNGRLNGLTRRVLRELPALPNVFVMPPGHEPLRREIAKRMALCGASVEPDDVVITNGTMEALVLALGVLCRPGDAVLVESPTYFGILQLLEHLRLKVVEVPNHPERGIDADALEYAISGTKVAAALLQSSFNNPTGAATPDAEKRRILEILAAREIPLIEDDIYGDLHFGNERSKPFAAFDGGAGSVITCASISKSVALGFRVGWVVAPRYTTELIRAKFCTSVATPTLQQHVVARYLGEGLHDRHLRRVREELAGNVQRFTEAIAAAFPPGTCVSRPQGGVVLWLELPKDVDGLSLFHAALAHRIGIAPGLIFSATGSYRNFIRLSAGVPLTAEIHKAIDVLGQLARAG
jgi:DNA-binding transcriptional MocR family regulator